MKWSKIEVYRSKVRVDIPIGNGQFANTGPQAVVIVIDDKVFVQDIISNREEQFAMAEITPIYIKLNSHVFEQIA